MRLSPKWLVFESALIISLTKKSDCFRELLFYCCLWSDGDELMTYIINSKFVCFCPYIGFKLLIYLLAWIFWFCCLQFLCTGIGIFHAFSLVAHKTLCVCAHACVRACVWYPGIGWQRYRPFRDILNFIFLPLSFSAYKSIPIFFSWRVAVSILALWVIT